MTARDPRSGGSLARTLGSVLCVSLLVGVGGVIVRGQEGSTDPDCVFLRGNVVDIENEGVVDANDAVDLVAYLLLGVSVPDCEAAADVNDNGLVEMSDYTYLIAHLFNDGPAPPSPYPEYGTDPTPGITVPDDRDPRFVFSLGTGAGIPGMTGVEIPVTLTNDVGMTGFQLAIRYNTRDELCPDLLIHEIRTEENTLLSAQSAEYITAEFDNINGVAYIATLKDFATPFWFHVGEDPLFPAGEDQLIATIVLGVASCADMGEVTLEFTDDVTTSLRGPPLDSLVALDGDVVRPTFATGGGTIEVRRGFIRGDANKDDGVDLSDPVFLLDYTFKGGPMPPCLDAADANNDTDVDLSDPIWILNYLFRGGPQPSEPFPQAGVDPSDDGKGSLGCESDFW